MNTIVVGSGNPDKLKEIRLLLKDLKVRVIPVTHFKNVPDVVEDGRTFAANAAKKARFYSRLSPHVTIADDSGLCVRALKNAPGVYSARYAGPGCTYADNNRKLLKNLSHKKGTQRAAFFVSTIAVYRAGKKIALLKGVCHGRIADAALGTHGFGYDPVFIPRGARKTFSQMTPAQKNRISHRSRALSATKKFLRKYFR